MNTLKTTAEIIDREILRLQKEKKKFDNASQFIKELKKKKKEDNKDRDKLIRWQQGLKTKMILSGCTNRDLAPKVGVAYQTINKWSNVIDVIPLKRAHYISILLNYPLPQSLKILIP